MANKIVMSAFVLIAVQGKLRRLLLSELRIRIRYSLERYVVGWHFLHTSSAEFSTSVKSKTMPSVKHVSTRSALHASFSFVT